MRNKTLCGFIPTMMPALLRVGLGVVVWSTNGMVLILSFSFVLCFTVTTMTPDLVAILTSFKNNKNSLDVLSHLSLWLVVHHLKDDSALLPVGHPSMCQLLSWQDGGTLSPESTVGLRLVFISG